MNMSINTDAIKLKMLVLVTNIDSISDILANKHALEFKTMKYMKKDLNKKKREYRNLVKVLRKANLGVTNG